MCQNTLSVHVSMYNTHADRYIYICIGKQLQIRTTNLKARIYISLHVRTYVHAKKKELYIPQCQV